MRRSQKWCNVCLLTFPVVITAVKNHSGVDAWLEAEPSKKKVLIIELKETMSRDFRPSVFFRQSIAPRPKINTLKYV
jgi:hypothetical protein